MGTWNVAGWTERNSELREAIIRDSDFDIVCVQETHLQNNSSIAIDGYKYFGYNRSLVHRRAPKGSGGVGIFIKESLLQYFDCTIVDKSFDGILCLSLKHTISNYCCYVFSCYLSPENSTWGRDATSFYTHLLSQIYMYNDLADALLICGDFNSRIGKLTDYVTSVDIVEPRNAIDPTINQHGNGLIEFLQESKFCTLNGRGDPSKDGFTCCTSRGMSVVDYVLVPHDILPNCDNFSVNNMVDTISKYNLQHLLNSNSKAPDHSLLYFELCINVLPSLYETDVPLLASTPTLVFNYNKPRPNFLQSQLSKDALMQVINQILCNRETQEEIDHIYEQFCKALYDDMRNNIPNYDLSKPIRKRLRPRKAFWDDEVQNLWHMMHTAEQHLKKSENNHIRKIRHRLFKAAQYNFDKNYRQKERAFKRTQSEYFSHIETNNPKQFWQELNKLGPKKNRKIPMEVYDENNNITCNIDKVLEKWKTDFEILYNSGNQPNDTELSNFINFNKQQKENEMRDPLYEENVNLNRNFTVDEVKSVVMKCKNGKSSGIDSIPYEVLKNDIIIDLLTKLFQFCLDTGKIPSLWQKSLISPIVKSTLDDPRIPLHYRGISLICCSAKIYSSLLNNRLVEHLNISSSICDEQNGFRKDRSCTDHVFSLHTALDNHLCNNNSAYVAFIDFQKAFDCINRSYLFSKILNNTIDGKVYWAIKSIYTDNLACVKVNNFKTDWFECNNGVRQGDTISPTLFSIFINDLADEINSLNKGINIGNSQISILMYADDVVLLANSEEDLQSMLDTLHSWSTTWLIDINRTKSKIVHFRKPRTTKTVFNFKIGNRDLDVDSLYKYLGTYFSEFLNFTEHSDILGESAGRALGSVVSKLKKNSFMNYSTYTKLFDSCVVPIVDYAASIWGFKNYSKPNQLQNKAMRIFLGVHRFAPVAGLEGDMAWLSPQYRRWLSMLRLWNRLVKMDDDRITKKVFSHMYSITNAESTNWCSSILYILNLIDLKECYDSLLPVNIDICKTRLFAQQKNNWLLTVLQKPKLRFYAIFKSALNAERYVQLSLSSGERSVLAQIRLGILKLHVETGRFTNTKLEERLCMICNQNVIEDESHFLFHCNAYDLPRNAWINSIYRNCPDFHYLEDKDQLNYIFSDIPRSTAKFIITCLKIRNDILYT